MIVPDRRSNMPGANHPWRSATNPDAPQQARLERKCTMVVTKAEEKAIRARALAEGGLSVSAFLRKHFPPELLQPLPSDESN